MESRQPLRRSVRTGTPLRRAARLQSSLATALLAAAPLLGTVPPFSPPGQALELRGATYFQRAPWKVDLVSYYSIVGQPSARYYFTVVLPEDAGASLDGLTIRQTRGVDNQFRFSPERTEAFVGRPRQEGRSIAVEASFDQRRREVRVTFPEPVAPGTTLTVMLKPWANPSVSDTYMFQVQAFPAGPNPSPASLGFATLRIYDPDWR